MAKESNSSIGVTIEGDGTTTTYVPPGSPMTNAAAPNGGAESFVLLLGANTIPIPAGAIGVVLSPPTASSNAKIIKGVAGDTGISIRPNSPLMLTFAAGAVSFDVDSAAATETVDLMWL